MNVLSFFFEVNGANFYLFVMNYDEISKERKQFVVTSFNLKNY